jgi:hypothetical protein
MSRLSVSIVMPNYNHDRFLERSLGAVLGQHVPADEIILIDDASTDGSRERIERLTAGRANVQFLRNASRCGAVAALNKGLELATGDLIAFPAADDQLFAGFIAATEPLLRAAPQAAFACTGAEIRDEHDRHVGFRPVLWPTVRPRYVAPAEARDLLARGDNFFLGAVTLYRRRALIEAGGFEAALGSLADGMLQRRLAVRHGFCFEPQTLGVWRHHASNYSITSVTDPQYLREILEAARACIVAEPAGVFPPGYGELFTRRLSFSAARLVLIGQLPPEEKAARAAVMLGLGPAAQKLVRRLCALGRPGAVAALTWLTLRQRPFSLAWMGIEPFRRLAARALPSGRPPTGL